MKTTRKFGGRRYKLESVHKTKTAAKAAAKRERRAGYNARVVALPKYSRGAKGKGVGGRIYRWAVWVE